MTRTKIRKAGPPLKGGWCLEWQSEAMPAPAFWYFDTRPEAEVAETGLRGNQARQRPDLRTAHASMLREAVVHERAAGHYMTADYLARLARA